MKIISRPTNKYSISTHKKVGIQIHKTLGLMPETLRYLLNTNKFVSANVLFARNGDVYEMVPANKRAWASGRINQPSKRVINLMKKTPWFTYVEPGQYLLQYEFECLSNQTFTEEQYKSVVEYTKKNATFPIQEKYIWTHNDTATDKPNLDKERTELIKRLGISESKKECEVVISNFSELGIKKVGRNYHLFKK